MKMSCLANKLTECSLLFKRNKKVSVSIHFGNKTLKQKVQPEALSFVRFW